MVTTSIMTSFLMVRKTNAEPPSNSVYAELLAIPLVSLSETIRHEYYVERSAMPMAATSIKSTL
jgi:hypothetical protein